MRRSEIRNPIASATPFSYVKTEHICGRPLGLRFDKKTGDLYIADAYFGLLKSWKNIVGIRCSVSILHLHLQVKNTHIGITLIYEFNYEGFEIGSLIIYFSSLII
ncbi:hypothetical protein AAZX31_12G091800 [Glycine max]